MAKLRGRKRIGNKRKKEKREKRSALMAHLGAPAGMWWMDAPSKLRSSDEVMEGFESFVKRLKTEGPDSVTESEIDELLTDIRKMKLAGWTETRLHMDVPC